MATLAQKQLRPGSFRGVPFETQSAKTTVGRRVQIHEFPQRDVPYVEDLGKKARKFEFTAVVVGADYVEKMQRLLDAIETPGPGILIHPWFGKVVVLAESANDISFSSKLRMATVTLKFVESGENRYPETTQDTKFKSKLIADLLNNEAVKSFAERFNVSGAQDFVQSAISGNLQEMLKLDAVQDIGTAFGMLDDLADLDSNALTLLSKDPLVLGNQIANAFGLSRVANVNASWRRVVRQLSALVEDEALNKPEEIGDVALTSSAQIQENTIALQDLIRQVTVSNIVGATALVGTEKDRVNDSAVVTTIAYQDLVELRDVALKAIDSELLKTVDDNVYRAIEDGYSAVFNDLTVRAEKQAQLLDYVPPAVLPAVVIAYDRYGDANRDLEIVERNKISHEGFVPKRVIKLLSE